MKKNYSRVNILPDSYKKKYRRFLVILLVAAFSALLGFCYRYFCDSFPDRITLLVNREESFDIGLPLEAELEIAEAGSFLLNHEPLSSQELTINLNEQFTVQSEATGSYPMALRLFGLFTMKQVVLDVIEEVEVIPMGVPIGIIADTDGVLVLGTGKITEDNGESYEPEKELLLSGDYIQAVDGVPVSGKEELIELLQTCAEETSLTVRRENTILTVEVPVVESVLGEKKIGVWVRDDTQGIGTLTYITSDGVFGALGHGITDVDTGILMEFQTGTIYTAEIHSIVKGKAGEPGELTGVIHQGEKAVIGELLNNTSQGIYGKLKVYPEQIQKLFSLKEMNACEIAFWNEIEVGEASILSAIEGEPKAYRIEIEKVKANIENISKGLVIRVTDEHLIELTGGIIQGLSGSPILQNGRIVGAVTHVLVNDPTRGYGIFIENMLEH